MKARSCCHDFRVRNHQASGAGCCIAVRLAPKPENALQTIKRGSAVGRGPGQAKKRPYGRPVRPGGWIVPRPSSKHRRPSFLQTLLRRLRFDYAFGAVSTETRLRRRDACGPRPICPGLSAPKGGRLRPVGPACRVEPLRPPLARAVDPVGLPFFRSFLWFSPWCSMLAQAVDRRLGGTTFGPLWGPRYGVRPKAEGRSPWGCRVGAPKARAKGRLRPGGAGGAKPQEAVGFCSAKLRKVIHRRRVKNRLKDKGLKPVRACG